MSLYKKGTIASSVWYDFKNRCSTPARKKKNGSFTEALRFSERLEDGLFDIGLTSQCLTKATMFSKISKSQSATILSLTHLKKLNKK